MDQKKRFVLLLKDGCRVQIKLLDDVIAKALPTSSDSRMKRGGKALRSLRYEAKAQKIAAVIQGYIQGYIQALTYHAAASLGPSAGTVSHTLKSGRT